MSSALVLISSWSDGVFAFSSHGGAHELPGRCVSGLAADGRGGALAVLDGTTLVRRSDGEWRELATSRLRMECCVAAGDAIYAGTEGAHVLRVREREAIERVDGFERMEGRASWYAGSAIVDGKVVGPPLAVRSLAGSSDGRVLLAGVHVGGIARSVDAGATWHPTIDIDWDVHDVRVHPANPAIVAAACAAGLAVSLDAGATWTLDRPTGDEVYCSAVAFSGDDVLVSVSSDHFAPHGTVLRRPIGSPGFFSAIGDGLPDRLEGIVDTRCLASNGSDIVVVDEGGNVHASGDGGRRWTHPGDGVPDPSGALVVRLDPQAR